ncbi:hypothetical protein VUR80DRAFT_5224 [Thermomyces stellatus]
MALKAFGGQLFALYPERLPQSLSRGFKSPFTPSDPHTILRDMSSALSYLADKRIVHNDIKPASIAFSPSRGAVLLDFGLAMSSADNPGVKMTGGTPWYVPPGILSGERRGAPADVWALGVTMLYVVGKISLPEETTRSWIIKDVEDMSREAYRRITEWLDIVDGGRQKLNRADQVGDLVYRMLEKQTQRQDPGTPDIDFPREY